MYHFVLKLSKVQFLMKLLILLFKSIYVARLSRRLRRLTIFWKLFLTFFLIFFLNECSFNVTVYYIKQSKDMKRIQTFCVRKDS